MQPNAVDVIVTIGQPRIEPYRKFFQCNTDEETLGAYFWGQAVSSAFQSCLGIYEVTLRNAIHSAATKLTGKATWYDHSAPGALHMNQKTLNQVDEELCVPYVTPPRRLVPPPAPGQIIAALSLGFWSGFINGLPKGDRSRILTDTFSSHPHSTPKHWSHGANVHQLMEDLKRIQQLRNAVAHFEPIWKPHRLKGTETHWSHCVVSLRELHQELISVTSWCSPAAAQAAETSYTTRIFKSICSTDAVIAFKENPFGAGTMALFKQPRPVPRAATAALRNRLQAKRYSKSRYAKQLELAKRLRITV